jgi:alkaline phosphatase D
MRHHASPLGLGAALAIATVAIGLGGDRTAPAQESKYGQFAPADAYVDGSPLAYYGSENEWSRRQFSPQKAAEIYGRRGQRQLLATLDGHPEQAIQWAAERLADDPQDLEAMFNRVVATCQLGQLDESLAALKQSVAAGLPVERFVAGPRDLLRPLTEWAPATAYLASQSSRLLHGPMLGCVTDRSARVWVRLARAQPVEVRVYACDPQGQPTPQMVSSGTALASPQRDFTATIDVTGLTANTQYAYDVLIENRSVVAGDLPRLKTFAAPGQPQRLTIAFGGGAGYTPEYERMWTTIAGRRPDALFLLGDNVYIDLPEEPRGLHQYTYYRRQSRPEYRALVANTAVYAIWDDHDCAMDDVWMGPYLDRPVWKPAMLRVFRENWVNPGYGNDAAPGCWFATTLGDIDFFFLDTRYYRTNPRGEHPTMLGPVQKKWLLAQLKKSRAKYKVLVSSVPWAPNSKPGSRDTWDGFPDEREEIFGCLGTNKIDGVVLLAADRHRSDAWKIERPGGYPLYEMMSSKLTNWHTHECLPGSLFCYNEACSCGLLTFDTTLADPSLRYEIVNIDGETIQTLELRLSELRSAR